MIAAFTGSTKFENQTMNKLEQFNKDYDLEFRNKLYRAALKECGNLHADDVVQKTSVIMWNKYDSYRQGTCFFAWGLTIMDYVLRNLFRKVNKSLVIQDQDKFEIVTERMPYEAQGEVHSEVLDKLNRRMEELKPDERNLLNAVYLQGKDIREWAIENGKAPQTAFNKMNIIKKKSLCNKLDQGVII